MAAGRPYNIAPGAPSTIEWIESGLLNYGTDMTTANNPYELGLDCFIDVDQEAGNQGSAQRIYAGNGIGVVQRHRDAVVDAPVGPHVLGLEPLPGKQPDPAGGVSVVSAPTPRADLCRDLLDGDSGP